MIVSMELVVALLAVVLAPFTEYVPLDLVLDLHPNLAANCCACCLGGTAINCCCGGQNGCGSGCINWACPWACLVGIGLGSGCTAT